MDDCIFCQIARRERESWSVYETGAAYAFLDINPVSEYHTLVIPKRHAVDIFAVPEADFLGVMSALKHVVDLYRSRLGMKHLQVVSSSGSEAQQDVFHLHFHIVPRHTGDGQNVKWTRHPEMRERFDSLLAMLHK
jgi:histidine triad (HIT) family protein